MADRQFFVNESRIRPVPQIQWQPALAEFFGGKLVKTFISAVAEIKVSLKQ
jgi:hypothetical protein